VAVDSNGQVGGGVVNGENGQDAMSQNIPLRDDGELTFGIPQCLLKVSLVPLD